MRLDRRRLDDELARRSRRWSARGRAAAALGLARGQRLELRRRARRAGELLDQPARAGRREQRRRPRGRSGRRRRAARGGAVLSRKPDAPARNASTTYSSRSNVVSISTRGGAELRDQPPVASMPSSTGIRMSISTTSGLVSSARATASSPVARLGDDLDVGLGVEDEPEAAAHERLVVGEQDADHARRRRGTGSRARTAKPPPRRGPPRARRRTSPRARACRPVRDRCRAPPSGAARRCRASPA